MNNQKHIQTLVNIHRLEHELNFSTGYESYCQRCRSNAQTALFNLVIDEVPDATEYPKLMELKTHYEPDPRIKEYFKR